MTPTELLQRGADILHPAILPAGFAFEQEASAEGEAPYAVGRYIREERVMTLYVRGHLMRVTYKVGADYMDHAAYLRMQGADGQSSFLQASTADPMDGFVSLMLDIEAYAEDFVWGDGKRFVEMAQRLRAAEQSPAQ